MVLYLKRWAIFQIAYNYMAKKKLQFKVFTVFYTNFAIETVILKVFIYWNLVSNIFHVFWNHLTEDFLRAEFDSGVAAFNLLIATWSVWNVSVNIFNKWINLLRQIITQHIFFMNTDCIIAVSCYRLIITQDMVDIVLSLLNNLTQETQVTCWTLRWTDSIHDHV